MKSAKVHGVLHATIYQMRSLEEDLLGYFP